MTNDEKIFEVLQDLKSFLNYMDMMPNLEKLYNEVGILIDKKLYSDINVQDIEGNTFLHYAMQCCSLDWSEKLLRCGANPYIENNKGRNCFQVPKQYDYISHFQEIFKNIRLDENFAQKTKGFCQEFKQYLFDNLSDSSSFQEKPEEIKGFLKNIKMYSKDNFFKLLGNSLLIKNDIKIDYFLRHSEIENYTSEDNSKLFKYLTYRNYSLFRFKDKTLESRFFSLKFADNADFKEALVMLVLDNKGKSYILRDMIEVLFEQNFDLKKKTGAGVETLEDFLAQHKNTKEIFFNIKLNYSLEEKQTKKAMKI